MEHTSVISWHNPINLYMYITEKLTKFSKLLFHFYLAISNKYRLIDFPFPEFHVESIALDGISYYICIFNTIRSPNLCQRFLKGLFVGILEPKP